MVISEIGVGAYASVDVLQTPGSVELRGIYDFSAPAGSTEIPLHAAG